ncbi:YitT family protein [Propionivibrio sp.]|uniref:YitT family protein n=1 Tax=Propionivibrio sp. TaxID=2212460 RepID=UPI0025E96552|nr:YitT family protein [Propionivibrio sp.]MBK8745329.1 YitT family protein [Propionivibrio sp.]MBK8893313.1 YitT family protein [Propionivibrio sp.]
MDINPYHNVLEDVQALLSGTLLVALAIVLFRQAGLLTGGTPGLTFLAYYASGVPFGVLYFLINIPFYIFAFLALGRAFAFKTFCAVALLSLYSEWLPHWIRVESIDPVFAAILGGLLAGAGLLMLIRHQASLGGIGVLAIYLQQRHGWRAGSLQMIADAFIVCGALFIVDQERVVLSILGALVLNMVLAVNHRPGRYFGQ